MGSCENGSREIGWGDDWIYVNQDKNHGESGTEPLSSIKCWENY
jgi:hypothetical protein